MSLRGLRKKDKRKNRLFFEAVHVCVFALVSYVVVNMHMVKRFFTLFSHARRYTRAVLAVIVCQSVRLSQVGVVLRLLNLGSRKQRHSTMAQRLRCQNSRRNSKGDTPNEGTN